MKKYKIFLILFITFCLLIIGCSKSSNSNPSADVCAGLSSKFATDVQPIFNSTCAINSNCHATGSTNAGGPLTDYNKIFAKRIDIKGQVSAGIMPQTGSLTADQKNEIICWINSGAPNN